MSLDTSLLLRDIESKGNLFRTHKYIFLSAKSFPYFFLLHLKKIVAQQYAISEWFFLSQMDDYQATKQADNTLFYYQDTKTMADYLEAFGYVWFLQERNEVKKVFGLLDDIDQGKHYYIIVINDDDSFLLKKYLYYDISMTFDGNKKYILQNYVKNFLPEEYNVFFLYFFSYYYDSVSDYMTIENFFQLSVYLPTIKKNSFKDFIDDYCVYVANTHVNFSLFDLVTYFFQKKTTLFLQGWEAFSKKMSPEFWIFFWQQQLWYALLVLLSKNEESIQAMPWAKKVNRWFLKYGKNSYSYATLSTASLQLYQLDSLHKQHQTDLLLDLRSFFLLWLTSC
jgi:hypothetical protein